jgi:6-phosphogluconolactonase
VLASSGDPRLPVGFWVASCSRPPRDSALAGLELLRRDAAGALRRAGVRLPLGGASFAAAHPWLGQVYAVREHEAGQVVSVDVSTGAAPRISGVRTSGGSFPCHLTVHPNGRYLLIANYGDGAVCVLRLSQSGIVDDVTQRISHVGQGPVPVRQDGPHAHMVAVYPDGGTALSTDLGTDTVHSYRFDSAVGRLHPLQDIAMPPGFGPRHLVRHPDGTLYVLGELSGTILILRPGDRDLLKPVGELRACCAELAGPDSPAEIALSVDDRILYVSHRGRDCVSVFRVRDDRRLDPVADIPCGGACPRHLALCGDRLYVANQLSDSVAEFIIDQRTGIPRPAGRPVAVPAPSALIPVKERMRKKGSSVIGSPSGGGDGNRTRVQGFAGPCLSHSATPP